MNDLLLAKDKQLRAIVITASIFLISTLFAFLGVDIYFCIVLALWGAIFFYALSDLKNRMLLAAFLIAFFVFLLGGHFVYEFFNLKLNYYFSYEYYRHSNVLLAIALFSFSLSYIITEKYLIIKQSKEYSEYDSWNNYAVSSYTQAVKAASRTVFYITFPFMIFTEIVQKGLYVSTEGYASYYTGYASTAPYFVRALGNMAPYAMLIFLATMPRKSECKFIIPLFASYAVFSLLTGKRIYFVSILLFFVLYFFLRNRLGVYNDIWISNKMLIVTLILFPLFVSFLFEYNYLRFGKSSSSESFFSKILGFFQQQGFSSSVIRLGKYYEDSLNSNAYYSFFSILKWLRTNFLFNIFFESNYGFSYLRNSIEYAQYGNSFSNSLSLLALGSKNYLSGFGVGSCYIAELFHDFSYVGVVLGNMIYGILMPIFNNIRRYSKFLVWRVAFIFIVFESFVKAPRWNFDIVFAQFLNLAMWSAIFIIAITAYYISSTISADHYLIKEKLFEMQ